MQLKSAILILTLLLISPLSNALETRMSAGGATEYRTNAYRTDNNQGSETEQSAILRFGLTDAGEHVLADMDYSGEKRRYVQEKFDDETVIEGTTALQWRVLPHRFSLLLDHNLRDAVANSRNPSTPENRTKQQVVSLGGQFQANPSPVDNLFLLLRGSSVHFDEQSGNDNKREQISLSWEHRLSERSSINIGTSQTDVDYDENHLDDYRYRAAYTGASTLFMHGDLNIRIGVNKISRDDTKDMDGKTLRLTWTETPGSDPFQWSIFYANDITDSSIGLIGDDFIPSDSGSDSSFEETDIVTIHTVGIDFSYQFTQNQLEASLRWRDNDYETLPEDEVLHSLRLSLTRDFTHRSSGRFLLQHDEREYLDDNSSYDEDTVSLYTDYQITSQLDISFEIRHIKRKHTIAISNYEDKMAQLKLKNTF